MRLSGCACRCEVILLHRRRSFCQVQVCHCQVAVHRRILSLVVPGDTVALRKLLKLQPVVRHMPASCIRVFIVSPYIIEGIVPCAVCNGFPFIQFAEVPGIPDIPFQYHGYAWNARLRHIVRIIWIHFRFADAVVVPVIPDDTFHLDFLELFQAAVVNQPAAAIRHIVKLPSVRHQVFGICPLLRLISQHDWHHVDIRQIICFLSVRRVFRLRQHIAVQLFAKLFIRPVLILSDRIVRRQPL